VPGDLRVLAVELRVDLLDLLLVRLEVGVLSGIDETGLEEEVPEVVEVDVGADVGFPVLDLVQQGEELHVVADLHVQYRDPAAHAPLPRSPLPLRVTEHHLHRAPDAHPLREADLQLRQDQPRQEHRFPLVLLHRKTGPGEVDDLQVDPLADQRVLEDDVRGGDQLLPYVAVTLALVAVDIAVQHHEHQRDALLVETLGEHPARPRVKQRLCLEQPDVQRALRVEPLQRRRRHGIAGDPQGDRREVDHLSAELRAVLDDLNRDAVHRVPLDPALLEFVAGDRQHQVHPLLVHRDLVRVYQEVLLAVRDQQVVEPVVVEKLA
jgi:hypothetical protein